jgi:DNA-binding SARP family transcriptional activator
MLFKWFSKRIISRVGLIVWLLSSCAMAPVQEMSDARQAIQAAEAVGARTKAADSYSKAQTYLDKAEAALQQRQFTKARERAEQAKQYALEAREKVLTVNHETVDH